MIRLARLELAPEPVQARPLHVPVLRRPAGTGGTDDRPRRAPEPRRTVELGERRPGARRVQPAESGPLARGVGPVAPPQAAQAVVALAGPDRAARPPRELGAVPEPGLLGDRTGGVSLYPSFFLLWRRF